MGKKERSKMKVRWRYEVMEAEFEAERGKERWRETEINATKTVRLQHQKWYVQSSG